MPNKQKTQSLGSFIIQTPTTYTSGLIDTNNDDDLLSFPENIDNSLQSECNIIESVPQIIRNNKRRAADDENEEDKLDYGVAVKCLLF